MRTALAALALVLAACADDPSRPAPTDPPGGPADEVPRAAVELLVQRFAIGEPWSWYTMAPDGTGVRPFDGIPPEVFEAVPSADGRTLALVRDSGVDGHLWLMDRLTRASTPLVTGDWVVHAASWSPDGARLVLAMSNDDVSEDVFVVNRDGSGAVNLTPDPRPAVFFDRRPAWSPDGTTIAYSSTRNGSTRLWLMDPDGSHLRAPLVADPNARERAPVWSPDGAWLAFQAERIGPRGVEVGVGIARPDGTGYRIFPVSGPFTNLAWSPDGRLLYAGAGSLDWELHALDPATGATENLTRNLLQDVAARPLRFVAPPAWAGFGPPVRHAVGAVGSTGLAAGDLDGDGDLDLVALAPALASARLLRNTGGGAFERLGGLDTLDAPRTLAVADLDRDGFDDLAVGGAGGLQVFRGSAGGPGLPLARALEGELVAVGVADSGIDGSAELHAVVRESAGGGFRAQLHGLSPEGVLQFLLDGAQAFAGATAACAADATGEGYPDLVVLLAGAGASAVVVPGLGPSFAAPFEAARGLGIEAGDTLACADLDGDRRADLALLRPGAAAGLRVLRAGETGLGEPATLDVTGTALAAADLDRDGDADLVVADPAGGALRWLRNLGDGTFAPAADLVTGVSPARVVAADLDGDGWTDLAYVDASGAVGILPNLGDGT